MTDVLLSGIVSVCSVGISAIVGPLVVRFFDKRTAKKSEAAFQERIDIDSQINSVLDEILFTHGFHRVSITDYHNGEKSHIAMSFDYASMQYERTERTTAKIIKEAQKIPCSMISTILSRLYKAPEGYIVALDTDPEEPVRVLHKMYGDTQTYIFKIGEGILEGTLSCTMVTGRNDIDQSAVDGIKADIKRIQILRAQKMGIKLK